MSATILHQINAIDQSLRWLKDHRPDQYPQRFLQLVEERRKLRVLYRAQNSNPGIAAFGQSQVGKSYLMNCILQNNDQPFMVDSPKGSCNFVDEINPIGGGQEATGVVTRFSSYGHNPSDYVADYPIRFRSLSVKDIILIICDSYFNDFDDYTTDGEKELQDKCNLFLEKYSNYPEVDYLVLEADDLLDMKAYFRRHINNGQVYSVKTSFFDTLATIIDRVPVEEYAAIFSILWHYETEFTDLFNTCMSILQRLRYQEYVYLPIEAVLHGGVKQDTIMSVSCLQLLYDNASSAFQTDVFQKQGDSMTQMDRFTKSELCTVCSEVVIRISDSFLTSTGRYDTRGISDASAAKLASKTVSMSVLKNSDLLDFPGARAREKGKLVVLQGNKETLVYSFLRGKVAYLFNKYNEEKAINILLYCHHNQNNDATEMWQLLNRWVNEYVGGTPEKRSRLLQQTGISPLFHIGTMFNKDLQHSDNPTVGDNEKGVGNRWKGRFEDLLLQKCFHRQDVTWVKDWSGKGKPFQNCYMLRDFKFSNLIYEGWKETGKEQRLILEQEYYERMRRTFINSNRDHQLFADAELSWDVSATIGNDGALYIIEQLSKVAARIADARDQQIQEQLREVCDNCYHILKDYYVSTDVNELLEKNLMKANGVFREMEFACQADPSFFGHLLQALQISEAECFKEVHQLLPSLTSAVHQDTTIKDYELIRKRCDNFEGCVSNEEKWQRLMKIYRFRNKEQAVEFLHKHHVDEEKLFGGEKIKRKNSAVIAHALMELWLKRIRTPQLMGKWCDDCEVDELCMSDLVTCLSDTAQVLHLSDYMEQSITDYVDVLNVATINEALVADVLSSCVCDFVMDFGYRFLEDSKKQSAARIMKEEECSFVVELDRQESYDNQQMTDLFNEILTSYERFTPAYEANYNQWIGYMYVAFVAHLEVPEFDKVANEELKELLDGFANK